MRTAILFMLTALVTILGAQTALALGGDDVTVLDNINSNTEFDLATASDGTQFAAIMWDNGDLHSRIIVRRSTDSGTTWSNWATLYDVAATHRYCSPRILVAEGDENRVFIAYTFDPGTGVASQLHVAWSPLDADTGDFSHDTLLGTYAGGITSVDLASDAASYAAYQLYATWSADNGTTGDDVYFARSGSYADAWAVPYTIDVVVTTDRNDQSPVVVCGYGGLVHVAWILQYAPSSANDSGLRYRHIVTRASGGQGAWDDMTELTTTADNWDQYDARIAASPSSPNVMVASTRRNHATSQYAGVTTIPSGNGGVSWSAAAYIGTGAVLPGDLVYQETSHRWLLGLTEAGRWGYRYALLGAPATWSPLGTFAINSGVPQLAIDPSHDDRVGLLCRDVTGDARCVFDADWRADPGYPNLEFYFPVDLDYPPVSDPAVVDVDGDGDLEIAFTDAGDRICIYANSQPLPGWPVSVGTALSPAPVAIADMDGDGSPEILVGTADGRVFGYDAGGSLLSGFPYDTHRDAPAYITIASVGGPYRRAGVVAAGSWVGIIDHHGTSYPGARTHTISGATIASTPAVGDIDGDGNSEVVVAASSIVWAFEVGAAHDELNHDLVRPISGGITLADFDADGEVEIVVPLSTGVLHVLQEDGAEFAGSWPVDVASSALRGAAIADIRYLTTPEVSVTATDGTVGLLNTTGGVPFGWPNDTDGWYIYGKPILGRIVDTASSVIVGSRGYHGWAWGLLGGLVEGWPRALEDHVELTPAYGDLDLDGQAEVVFLTTTQLAVFDVGTAPGESRNSWPMAAHDSGRTGCWECNNDIIAVDDAPAGITRVSFASPWPNPVSGPTTFAFALPVAAIAELAVYDLRGCRVALVGRSELPAGQHQLTWNGHDRGGHPLASGHYLAALRVQGPGVDETLTRKFTVVH